MEETLTRIARRVDEAHYGKYRGFVVDNADPEKRARLKVRIPSVTGDMVSQWALPCAPFGGGSGYGLFAVPQVDDQVWIEFEEGDIDRPIWVGTFWQAEADVPEPAALDQPTTCLLQTPGEHRLQFDDEEGEERIVLHHTSGAELLIDENGTVILKDAGDNTLTMDARSPGISLEDANGNSCVMSPSGTTVEDANGNQLELGAAGITIKANQVVLDGMVSLGGQGGEPIVKGQSFLTYYAAHVHTCGAPGGPSSPPILTGEMNTLSTKVKTT